MISDSKESNTALMGLIEQDLDGWKPLDKRLYNRGLKSTGNHYDAEDLVGEFRLRIVKYGGNYKFNGDKVSGINNLNLTKWFNQIFYHLIVEYHRRRNRRRNQVLESDFSFNEESNNSLGQAYFSNRTPDDEAIANEEADIIKKELLGNRRISEKERGLLVMYYFDRMPQNEIADMLEIPRKEIRTRMCSARKTFSKLKDIIRLKVA